ncbi:MAG: hypothetical protein HQK88_08760 [Nitrospirae bacterium]|nr:hypothetical protein [Nitrospirota bacterium]MBF0535372.1 hypothetical protein [Nitrospirota bacterium]MBF0616892.1 hypothetical protein [Nitrospirota bacterium]
MSKELANKADLHAVKAGLTADLMLIKSELTAKIENLEEKMKVNIEKSKSETLKWMFLFWAGQLVAMFTLFKFFLK